jgi:hypothetical protein
VLLDDALRATFRNFTTLFLVVAVVTAPLHVGHSFVYRRVIAVQDLHSDIETFPLERQVHSVGRRQLDDSATSFWAITALEVLLLPLLVAAAGRVIEVDARGGVPTVVDAWIHLRLRAVFGRRGGGWWAILAGAAVALAVGYFVEAIGMIAVEPLPDAAAFAGTGLVQAISRASAVPFVLVPAVLTVRAKKTTRSSLGEAP